MRAIRPVLIFLLERLTLAGAGIAATLAVFLVLAQEVRGGETQRFDAEVFRYFQARQSSSIYALMTGLSLLASGWTISVVSLACVLAIWRKTHLRMEALSLLLAAAGGQGVVYGLKTLFHRARPEAAFKALGYSFPSGHAFAAVAIYGMLAYCLARAMPDWKLWIWAAAVPLILLIGFSRIYLGVHYASDVAAGFTVGVLWLWGCLALPAHAAKKRKN